MIQDVEVLEFNNLFSDAHCPLSLLIKASFCDKISFHEQTYHFTENVKLWDSDRSDLFINKFDPTLTKDVEKK